MIRLEFALDDWARPEPEPDPLAPFCGSGLRTAWQWRADAMLAACITQPQPQRLVLVTGTC